MALKSKSKPTRHDIPHEPGEWIEILPISASEWDTLDSNATGVQYTLQMASKVITAWSYGELTPETLADLDAPTFKWLDDNILAFAGIRRADEKKDSNGNSSATSATTDDSPETSSTS